MSGCLPVDLEHPEGPEFQTHPDKTGNSQLPVKARLALLRTTARRTSSISLAYRIWTRTEAMAALVLLAAEKLVGTGSYFSSSGSSLASRSS